MGAFMHETKSRLRDVSFRKQRRPVTKIRELLSKAHGRPPTDAENAG